MSPISSFPDIHLQALCDVLGDTGSSWLSDTSRKVSGATCSGSLTAQASCAAYSKFLRHGKTLRRCPRSASDDTTQIKGILSETESDVGSQRTYKRHRYRAEQGRWRGGNIPYGPQPDGHGWFDPDPEHYRTLCWILERRAEGLGYHRIAKMLNTGISRGDGDPLVPTTPGLLQYYRRPYLVQQDPETGDEMRNGNWKPQPIAHICKEAVDGVYAGIYNWGRTANRFDEDDQGQVKRSVRVDTEKPLIEHALLQRVQAVELGEKLEAGAPTTKNSYLLNHLLRCQCDQAIHGYTTSRYKVTRGGKGCYKYRKYHCAGRANKPGSCDMTILGADQLERTVVEAVFTETARVAPDLLARALREAVARRRDEILSALEVLVEQRLDVEQRRNEALDAVIRDRTLSDTLRQAVQERAEAAVKEAKELEIKERTLRARITALESQARSVEWILTHPDLDPARWEEPVVNLALQRALRVMVRRYKGQPAIRGPVQRQDLAF